MDIPLGENEVLIRVKNCGISHWDILAKDGTLSNLLNQKSAIIESGYEICGVIEKLGSGAESFFKIGNEVVGICPLDTKCGGCAQYTVQDCVNFVSKPSSVSSEQAAAVVGGGLRAFIALHYKFKLVQGECILVIDGCSAENLIAIQLASHWGAKVIVTVSNEEQAEFLKQTGIHLERILISKKGNICEEIMKETNGIGVDYVLEGYKNSEISRHEIIKCLGTNGHWITSSKDLQLDPPDSLLLFLKDASISYLFEHSWVLSNSQQGRYLHILRELMEKLSSGVVKQFITKSFPFSQVQQAIEFLKTNSIGKVLISSHS